MKTLQKLVPNSSKVSRPRLFLFKWPNTSMDLAESKANSGSVFVIMAVILLDGQGVDAGRGDRVPEAAAGAGAGDEPDEQHDDAHGHAAAADVRHGADGPNGPDGADGAGHDEHGLPRPARLRAAAHDAPAAALHPPALGRERRRGERGGRPRAAGRRQRHAGRLRHLPRMPTSPAERPGTYASSSSRATREADEVKSVQQQQQQAGSMEAYNRMLAMCQKLNQQQSQPSNSKQ
jgi:hypothetical protein